MRAPGRRRRGRDSPYVRDRPHPDGFSVRLPRAAVRRSHLMQQSFDVLVVDLRMQEMDRHRLPAGSPEDLALDRRRHGLRLRRRRRAARARELGVTRVLDEPVPSCSSCSRTSREAAGRSASTPARDSRRYRPRPDARPPETADGLDKTLTSTETLVGSACSSSAKEPWRACCPADVVGILVPKARTREHDLLLRRPERRRAGLSGRGFKQKC